MTNPLWTSAPKAAQEKVNRLIENLDLPLPIAKILVQRGIESFDQAQSFFRPQLSDLHDPFLMKDMYKAVIRLQKALKNAEKILIYGDYDVDGTTSVALMYQVLEDYIAKTKSLTFLHYYIPDRYTEGYGISFQSIDYAAENGFTLVIALDCGIKANDKIAYANQKNIDFIICDHHKAGEQIPEALAVLDPKRPDCAYPYKELSGCGVGFKLLQAFFITEKLDLNILWASLDFVMVSIACDIVPLTGENRILAYFGLQRFNSAPSLGLFHLKAVAAYGNQYNLSDVVFKIGPRINAAGRIESGTNAVKLLVSSETEIAKDWSAYINNNNLERKEVDEEITSQALAQIEACPHLQAKKTTVLFDANWHKGVIGIVASRLIETYYRPTIVLTESHGKICGSVRSVLGYDVYEALCLCSDLLEQFGGHRYAAGLTLLKENLPAFIARFETVVSNTITADLLQPKIAVDVALDFTELYDPKALAQNTYPLFYRILQQLAPFGPGHMNPVFYSKDLFAQEPKVIQGKHLRMKVSSEAYPQLAFQALGFNLAHKLPLVEEGEKFELVYTLEANDWQGYRNIQLLLKDVREVRF
jgi:single-stranded-DNA-specific exonuclease